MYSKDVELIINEAYLIALQNASEYCVREHLLLRLIKNKKIQSIFTEMGVDSNQLTADLQNYISQKIPKSFGPNDKPKVTEDFNSLLKVALQYAVTSGKPVIHVEDLLISFFYIKDSYAKYFLEKNGLYQEDIADLLNLTPREEDNMGNNGFGPFDQQQGQQDRQDKDLGSYLINLNEKALKNKIDPVIGREEEIERVIHILVRKKKNNPILAGEPGVGKTAIAEGLAKKIAEKNVHESLLGYTVYSLDLGGMTAGTKYRGEFEARLKKVVDKIKKDPKSILFIDEIHTIIGAGAAGGGSLDASNILKPALASGELKCIGATTYKEYRNVFEKDAALSRRFQKVDVSEPSVEDTKKILMGLKKYYEDHHKVEYKESALQLAVELSAKYITDRFLPDKAIDVIDEAGAYVKLSSSKEVNEEVVEKVISKIAKIPERQVVKSEKDKIKDLKSNLEMRIFGQEEAINLLVDSILLSKSGLRDSNKPIGSFLFCGPTGVGKTEVTKQLAVSLGVNLVRLDMSEYMEKHNVSKLIGAPPGYVGYEQEGVLSSAVTKHPHSIILLDELEKAHPDVMNIMLQIMDNGFLTDNYGKKIDFRQSIIIMTSNVGSAEVNTKRLGLVADDTPSKPTAAIERAFLPEFRNRLDAIVWFNSLNEKTIKEVLDKNLVTLSSMLLEKNVTISYTEEAKNWLAKKGYNPQMGARPMARLIQEKIKTPLSKEILFGKLEKGGIVSVDLKNEELVFSYSAKKERKKVVTQKS